MTDIKIFNEFLEIQNLFKRLKQFSWDIKQIETRYDVTTMDDEQIPEVLELYRKRLKDLEKLLVEVRNFQ